MITPQREHAISDRISQSSFDFNSSIRIENRPEYPGHAEISIRLEFMTPGMASARHLAGPIPHPNRLG